MSNLKKQDGGVLNNNIGLGYVREVVCLCVLAGVAGSRLSMKYIGAIG